MRKTETVESKKIYMGGLDHGSDLLEELTAFCVDKGVQLGRVEAIGAVQKARVGFYDQTAREYEYVDLDMPAEITNLTGNISMKDGKPFVHAHITLYDDDGGSHGGHLAEGTIVFACEFVIEQFSGPTLDRSFDETTGLTLW